MAGTPSVQPIGGSLSLDPFRFLRAERTVSFFLEHRRLDVEESGMGGSGMEEGLNGEKERKTRDIANVAKAS